MPMNARVSTHLIVKMQNICQLALDHGGIIVRVESQHDVLLLRQQIYNVRKHLVRAGGDEGTAIHMVELRIKKPEQDAEGKWAMHIVPIGDAYAELSITSLQGDRLVLQPSGQIAQEMQNLLEGPSEPDIAAIKAEIEASYSGKLPKDVAGYEKLDAEWEHEARLKAAQGYRVRKTQPKD